MMNAAMDRRAAVRRLLLVDDDKALRQSLAEQLSFGEEFGLFPADEAFRSPPIRCLPRRSRRKSFETIF